MKRNAHDYANLMVHYNVARRDYDNSLGSSAKFDDLLDEAESNATYRMDSPQAADLAVLVDAYHRHMAELPTINAAPDQAERLVLKALEDSRHQREAVSSAERALDGVHNAATAFLKGA